MHKKIVNTCSHSYGGIFRTYILLLFISCARLFYFVDRFFFSIISCARLFYFVDRFFFSIISCARLFLFYMSFFSFLLSRAHDFFFRVSFFFYCLVRTTYWFIFWWKATFTPDSRPTPDKCRPIFMAWSVWSGKKNTRFDWRAYISPINNRCIRAVSLMHPRSNLALPDLTPPFGWPIPALHDQPRPIPDTTTLNIGPTPDLYAWFSLSVSNE